MKLQLAWLWMLSASMSPTIAADSWPGFQAGGNVSVEATSPPTEWSPEKGIAWETPLAGYGQSSPVVKGNTIYVTSISGKMKDDLFVQAFDRPSGKELWKYERKNSTPQENTNYVSRAAPTPTCDEAGVIAFFEGGNLIALTPDGKLRWERDLVNEYGPITARHGLASSLEQTDQFVFVWVERSEDPYLLAVNKSDGKNAWKIPGLGTTSWSSPRLIPVGDSEHLVLSGSGKLRGIDPADGKQLWSFDGISNNTTPTPIPVGDGRFLMGASVGRGETGGGDAAASNGLIEIHPQENGAFKVGFAWSGKRATSSFGSPLAHKGHAYFVNSTGVVYCLDLKTGEERYAQRTAGSIWATPIGIGNQVYLFGKDGSTTIIKAGPEFEEVGVNSLWKEEALQDRFSGSVLYAAALVDSEIIFRRGDRLYKVSR